MTSISVASIYPATWGSPEPLPGQDKTESTAFLEACQGMWLNLILVNFLKTFIQIFFLLKNIKNEDNFKADNDWLPTTGL